jgi:D-alanyl-D-alanine carboxypeptidase
MKRSLKLLWSCLVFCASQISHAQTLREQIDTILSRPTIAANTWTILVQNDAGTVNYYDRNPTLGQIPASNTKLFTVSAAFGLLGTNHFFESRVYCDGTLTNGTLIGNLNLVSEHDMTWNEHVFGTGNARAGLDYIAARLRTQGLTNVLGNVQCFGVCYYRRLSADTAHNSQSQDVYNAETAGAILGALQAQGISVSGSALGQIGFHPSGSLFYTHKSSDLTYGGKPLTLDVACIPLAKVSHNVMADELLRHLGYKLNDVDSFDAGSALVFDWLQNIAGISTNGMVMSDGSGLSHGNRFSAQQINRLMRYMLGAFPGWPAIFPIGCGDGTLNSRFCNTDGANRVHAKTGSLSDTISLSGYIDNKYSGRRFIFSFIRGRPARPSTIA